ncbi:YidB family protein [Methylobacillus methanolivorans]
MGLFDSIAGSVMNKVAGNSGNPMIQAGLELMNKSGGPQGVLDKLRANGLGAEVESWLGSGSNLPLSLQQVVQVFGAELIKSMAAQLSLPTDDFGRKLAEYLPQAIDKLSPDGKLPGSQAELMARAFSLIK